MTTQKQFQVLRTIPSLIAICLSVASVQAKYSGGSGTIEDPHQIATAQDLILLGDSPEDYDRHFVLTADIDLDPNLPDRRVFDRAVIAPCINDTQGMLPEIPFTGVFDGDGHIIRNLTCITGNANYLGLFGRIGGPKGIIRDVRLVNVMIDGAEGWYVGGLVAWNAGTVINCSSAGTLAGGSDVGGLVGINAEDFMPELGALGMGSVTNCFSAGTVTGRNRVGGLSGYNMGNVICCHSTAAVRGDENVGGLVGWLRWGSVVASRSTGTVRGVTDIGGLTGRNEGTIVNCRSSSTVHGDQSVGGLAGHNRGRIGNCYSVGTVAGTGESVGGLVGKGSALIGGSFWDVETSGLSTSAGGVGLITVEMQNVSTYLDAGWDFLGERANGLHETWLMPEGGGYPVLSTLDDLKQAPPVGHGTVESPYLISTPAELAAVMYRDTHASYRLTNDIDLSGTIWTVPIIPYFAGYLDGSGFAIRNLEMKGHIDLALIGVLFRGGRVSDLHVGDANIAAIGNAAAIVADSYGELIHCSGAGSVRGTADVGGLVGRTDGTVSNSHSTVAVSGTGCSVGGLAGLNAGTVNGCSSTDAATGSYGVGGLVGCNWGIVDDCQSTSVVTGSDSVGGLVGENDYRITNSRSAGAVKGVSCVGGLVGFNEEGTITNSCSTGEVTGERKVGGLVGANEPLGSIFASYSTGPVRGTGQVGGLSGSNNCSIGDCYSTGAVSGDSDVGGLVGLLFYWGGVTHCYSTGVVSGNENTGGLLGDSLEGRVVGCFWDMYTSGHTSSADGKGRTTTEMQKANTFLNAGWDFVDEKVNGTNDIWWILEGKSYPRLWWEVVGE